MLAQHDGAKTIACGGTFTAALTHDGSALLWGRLPGDPNSQATAQQQVLCTNIVNLFASRAGRVIAVNAGYE